MDTLRQDLRFALRTLARHRAFTVSAVLCLALGIGLNTAVFSLVNALLLKPYGFDDAERVTYVYGANPRQGVREWTISPADYWEFREGARTLTDLAAMRSASFAIAGTDADAERVEGLRVTANLFPLLGVQPLHGRQATADEGRRGAEPVVLLGHGLFERRFAADPRIVGRAVLLDGTPHTVIGVMPRGFGFPATADLWVPMVPERTDARDARVMVGVGRIAPGRTAAEVQAELAEIAARAVAAHPATNTGWSTEVVTFRDDAADGALRSLLALMSAAVGFVLLIACANVANLLLARAAARERELALRAALGGTRARLARQMLTESVLVALVGGGLGILVAVWWMDLMFASIPEQLPYWLHVTVDGRVLAFTAAVSLGTGLLFGALPALRASRPDLQGVLKSGGRTDAGGGGRLRGALVAGEIALAVMLLTAATLMTRGFLAISAADAGFDTRGVLTMRTYMAGARYDSAGARARYLADAVRAVEALPGIAHAAATTAIPTDDGGPITVLDVEGRPVAAPGEELLVTRFGVTAGYFDALGAPLLAGRPFTEAETLDRSAPVTLVNRALAERLWPDGDALGQRVRLRGVGDDAWFTVVGVTADLVYEEFGEETAQSRLQVHLPYAWSASRTMAIMVRARDAAAAGAAAGTVRTAIRDVDPTLPTFDVRTMEEVRRYTQWPHRVFSASFASFAALALVLAAVGIYGVMSYHVSQRVRSIGVRLALGASPSAVLGEVLRHGARLAAVGAVAGAIGAVAVGRAMAGVLYGVGGIEPLSLVGVPLVLGAVALLACYLPARRATRIDPLQALRSE